MIASGDTQTIKLLVGLTTINPNQTQILFSMYKKYVNKQFIGCGKCASSIRQAHKGLKAFYNKNK